MPGLRAARRYRVVSGLGLVALVALAGCKEQKSAGAASGSMDPARFAAEMNIRAGAPAAQMSFRGEAVYAQAIPQRVAVCGLVNPFPDDAKMFVPFVSIVTNVGADAKGAPQFTFEKYIGVTTAEAGRVYLAIVNYCYDKGGPATGPVRSVMPMAPLPDSVPDPAVRNVPPPTVPAVVATGVAPPAGTTTGTPASGSVTMRQAGNLHSDPGGPTLRVVPQGTAMHVFAQATGGWYQVGDTAPWGWMHQSMLEKH